MTFDFFFFLKIKEKDFLVFLKLKKINFEL